MNQVEKQTFKQIISQGTILLFQYFSLHPHPQSLLDFTPYFSLQYTSTNPTTNSKKPIHKLYTPSSPPSTILLPQTLIPTLSYKPNPVRIQLQGTWEGWLVDQTLHKEIYQDQMFGVARVSGDRNRWVYVARVEMEKGKGYFEEGDGKEEFVHDYGERYGGKTHNGIFVYDRGEKKTKKLLNEGNLIVSSPSFLDQKGETIVFHAYQRQNFGYGLAQIFNRNVHIYIANQQGNEYKVVKMETKERTNMFPSVSLCEEYLAYFSGSGRTHCFYMSIVIFKKGKDDNWEKYHEISDFFIGFYAESKIYFYQLDNKPHFLCQTYQKASNIIYTFDVENKILSKVTNPSPTQTHSIISFNDKTNLLVVRYSNVGSITFVYCYLPDPLQLIPSERVQDYQCQVFDEPIHHFVIRKKDIKERQPCVIFLHGGPHGVSDPTLNPFKYLFIESGYTVLIPNYSGSVGYGKQFLQNALGRIGEVEAQEIVKCVRRLVEAGKIDEKRVFTYGGSHGGFLGGILAAKYHQHFAGVVMINPVLSLPFMISASDLPDWVMVEGLNKIDTLDHLTSEDYAKLYDLSPIANPPKIPVCLLIGAKDRRVPHQAVKIYVALAKSKGVKVELYIYPESEHRLIESVQTQMDVLLKAYKFIQEIVKKDKQ